MAPVIAKQAEYWIGFTFSMKWGIASLTINYVPIIKMWSNKCFINNKQWKFGRVDWNLRMRPIVLETLSKTPFKWSLKFSFLSKIKPRFWDLVWLTRELLKVILSWIGLLSFLLKITENYKYFLCFRCFLWSNWYLLETLIEI